VDTETSPGSFEVAVYEATVLGCGEVASVFVDVAGAPIVWMGVSGVSGTAVDFVVFRAGGSIVEC
jgi:hypothetical protein